jgi:hypothetical protein
MEASESEGRAGSYLLESEFISLPGRSVANRLAMLPRANVAPHAGEPESRESGVVEGNWSWS